VGVTLTIKEAIQKIPHFLGGPDEAIAEDLYTLGNKKLNPQKIKELKDKLFTQWLKKQKVLPTREGIFDFLKKAKEENTPVAIGSATEKGKVYDYITRGGLKEFFPDKMIVTGEDVTQTKPAPDIYLECAKRLGVSPNNMIVFEDSGRGVTAGRAAGAYVIGMPVYYTPEVIKKLKDAGAREIYRSWSEVKLTSFS
jgi:beta-phosphoglucomutase-like phosphatase (HAD superfamily)